MSQRLLLDTNIVLDYLVHREPFFADARKLMILGSIGEVELHFSALQLTDAFYILSDGGKPARSAEAQDKLAQCRRFVHICAITEQDIDRAFELCWSDIGKRQLNHPAPSSGQSVPALSGQTPPLPQVGAASARTDPGRIDSESGTEAFIGTSLEDAFVAVCADKQKADCIISRDVGFEASTRLVLSPAEYFKRLETEWGLTYGEITLGMDVQ